MDRTSAAAWRRAATLPGLNRCTVRWLDGQLRTHPARGRRRDLDATPQQALILQALNVAGFLTVRFAPGRPATPAAGIEREQRSVVEGFAPPGVALPLSLLGHQAGLDVITHDPARLPLRDDRRDAEVDVARDTATGRALARAGAHLSRDTITGRWEGIPVTGISALCGAWQVTLADPEWGNPDHLAGILAVWAGSVLPVPAAV